MAYPVAIEAGDNQQAFGVVVPDLPGCFSAGDTFAEAVQNAREAIELWLADVIEQGGVIPAATGVEKYQADPEFAGWSWAVVQVDLS
jgi:predicted RNase H-like HicB family nuclease